MFLNEHCIEYIITWIDWPVLLLLLYSRLLLLLLLLLLMLLLLLFYCRVGCCQLQDKSNESIFQEYRGGRRKYFTETKWRRGGRKFIKKNKIWKFCCGFRLKLRFLFCSWMSSCLECGRWHNKFEMLFIYRSIYLLKK